ESDVRGPRRVEFAACPVRVLPGGAEARVGWGGAYVQARRPGAAATFCGQALEIVRGGSDVDRQGDMFVGIADAARHRGDRAAENAALDRAAELYESVHSPKAARLAERRAAR